jgi:hypothetical protein
MAGGVGARPEHTQQEQPRPHPQSHITRPQFPQQGKGYATSPNKKPSEEITSITSEASEIFGNVQPNLRC